MQFYPERAPSTKHKWGPQPLLNGYRVAACGARAVLMSRPEAAATGMHKDIPGTCALASCTRASGSSLRPPTAATGSRFTLPACMLIFLRAACGGRVAYVSVDIISNRGRGRDGLVMKYSCSFIENVERAGTPVQRMLGKAPLVQQVKRNGKVLRGQQVLPSADKPRATRHPPTPGLSAARRRSCATATPCPVRVERR